MSDSDDREDDGGGDSSTESTNNSIASAVEAANQMEGLGGYLASKHGLAGTLARIQELEGELAGPIADVQQMRREVVQTNVDLLKAVHHIQPQMEQMQEAISAIQSARAYTEAYNQQLHGISDAILQYREAIRTAVEDQLELEMPSEYESVDPDQSAKSAAEEWVIGFLEGFDDVENEYFSKVTYRIKDGLEEFQNEPERPYAAIHIFISMQDALLWWLCYQDDEIDTEAMDEVDLPKYGTDAKQKALRKYYNAYFGVGEEDPARISDYKWDSFWSHRHAIMHGDLRATYDMNIATTALLFFALTAHSVLKVIEEYDESGDDVPAIMDDIAESESVQPEDVESPEALGEFFSAHQQSEE